MRQKLASKKLSLALLLVGCTLLICGITMLYARHQATHDTKSTATKHPSIHTDDHPSEAPVDGAAYRVADQPYRITIERVSIKGYVQRVSVNKRNEIGTPSNVNVAGWFDGSTKPGQPGISIIDGHVQGRYRPGVFKRLSDVKAGDKIIIEYGNGKIYTFTTKQTVHVQEDKASKALYDKLPGVSRQLTLITCSGAYDKTNDRYTERTLVYAEAAQ